MWLSTLLARVRRARRRGTWILAEGADAARVARSMPIDKAMKDVLVAYAQNGEPLRPEQGYPLRLIVPGVEGITNIKWLHRVESSIDQPAMTRWETSKYTDLLPDGTSRIFSLEMDAKSIITRPSGGETLPGAGVYEISGLAWSGHGSIARVDITTDGGATWKPAELQTPVLPFAHTRFRGRGTGMDATRSSRRARRTTPDICSRRCRISSSCAGSNSGYHNNAILPWKVTRDRRRDQRAVGRAEDLHRTRRLPALVVCLAARANAHVSVSATRHRTDAVNAIDIDVLPDGQGLPPGSGRPRCRRAVVRGALLCLSWPDGHRRSQRCARRRTRLADDRAPAEDGRQLLAVRDDVVGLHQSRDAVRRSRDRCAADDVYAVTAYVLFLNGIVTEHEVLSQTTLAAVKMPNRNGFVPDNRANENLPRK